MSLFKRKANKQPGRRGRWYKEEHFWGKVTYRCSRCGSRFRDCPAACPKCGSVNGKVKSDPLWVDEMSEYDLE